MSDTRVRYSPIELDPLDFIVNKIFTKLIVLYSYNDLLYIEFLY